MADVEASKVFEAPETQPQMKRRKLRDIEVIHEKEPDDQKERFSVIKSLSDQIYLPGIEGTGVTSENTEQK
jgi:hypothetical protein